MKVLHILPSLEQGGAQRALLILLEGCLNQAPGVKHIVRYRNGGPYVKKLQAMGIEVLPLHGFWGLLKTMWQERPTVVHAWMWSTGVMGRIAHWLTGVPVLCAVHSTAHNHKGYRLLVDRFTRWGSTFCGVSDEVCQTYMAATKVKDMITVRNGIDAESVRAQGAACGHTRSSVGLPNDAFIIGFVGRLVPVKQPLVLIELLDACQEMARAQGIDKKIVLCVVGSGPLREQMPVRDDVIMLGDRNDVYGIYPLLDCSVLVSKTEGLSYTILESLCFGLPVFTTGQPGAHEIIRDEVNGGVVLPDKRCAEMMAHKIVALMTKPGLVKQIKDKNVALVASNFARSHMVDHYLGLYRHLGGDHRGVD